jgi:hypothetical protein
MKTQRLALALTVINLVILMFALAQNRPQAASNVAPVLRGQSLEIVDTQGRVRASIKVHPPSVFKPTGKKYPDTVMLRLVDPNGRPEVKIGASVDGGGLGFVGKADKTQVILQAEGPDASLKLANQDDQEQIMKP